MSDQNIILVTGGAGFIGSHLVDALIKQGFKVRVLDNLSRPSHNRRLPDWFNKQAEFVKGDVRERKDWIRALKGVGYIFHLASYMDFHLDFSKYLDVNVKSTALMYETIVQQKLPVKKIVIASSQSVYGEGKYLCPQHGIFYPPPRTTKQLKKHQWEITCPEDGQTAQIQPELETDQLQPQTPYAVSKAASEQLGLSLGKTYQIPTVALRYSIVLGARQSFRHFYSGALRDFSVRAVANLPILTHEDALQIRDFVSVHDVVAAHLLVLQKKEADYQSFNVGSSQSTEVISLAETVCRTAKSISPIRPTGEFRINAPRHSVMNIDRIKKLGFLPKHPLEDSVLEYINWIRNYPQALKYWRETYKKLHQEGILKQ